MDAFTTDATVLAALVRQDAEQTGKREDYLFLPDFTQSRNVGFAKMRRYAHLSSEHLAQYVERFSPLRVVGREGVTKSLRLHKQETSGAS